MAARGEYDDSIRRAMNDLVTGDSKGGVLEHSLATVTAAAVELVDGVDFADVMIISEDRMRSVSPTVPLLAELDTAQVNLRQGPCLEAATSGAMVRCTDLRTDVRWPKYAAVAVAAGVHSMLSFQLITANNGIGALNMFGLDPRDADPAAEAIGALTATLATVALMVADSQEQFVAALSSRDLIGHARGMLMNHFGVDAGHAFEMLRDLSQSSNISVRIIAQQIVETL